MTKQEIIDKTCEWITPPTYKVTHNGISVNGKIIYTKKGLLFVSGKEIYKDGSLTVESNFTNRLTPLFCAIIYLLLLISLMIMLIV